MLESCNDPHLNYITDKRRKRGCFKVQYFKHSTQKHLKYILNTLCTRIQLLVRYNSSAVHTWYLIAFFDEGKSSITAVEKLIASFIQEASDWTEFQVMIESWELMPTLDERIELRWIMGGRDDASCLSV